MRIVLLCGPPCAGKTTLAHRMATPGDLILDYDDIARQLGSPTPWNHPEPYRTQAEQVMQQHIAQAQASTAEGTAWVIRTAPTTGPTPAAHHPVPGHLLPPQPRRTRVRTQGQDRPTPERYG